MCTCMCGGVISLHVHRCVMHIHNYYRIAGYFRGVPIFVVFVVNP